MVDTQVLGTCIREDVRVRLPPPAPRPVAPTAGRAFFCSPLPMRFLSLLGLLGVLAGGCAAPQPAFDLPPLPAASAFHRPSDGLLDRDDLQALVERQTRRDSAAVRAALRSSDPAVRARAAFAIGSVQDPAAVPELLRLLRDPVPSVRADAAFALGQSASAEAAIALMDALRAESDLAVRRLLLEALGKTGDLATLTALPDVPLPATLEADRALSIARYGLRGIHDPDATSWLSERLTSSDPLLREAAAYVFSRFPTPEPWLHVADAVRAAVDGLDADDPAQMYLVLALGRLPDKNVEFRRMRLLAESADWRVRTNAARALARHGVSPQAHAALLDALDDPSAHVAAAAAAALSTDTLGADLLDRAEAWIAAHPDAWRVWTPLLPALVGGGRTQEALRWTQSLRPSRPVPVAIPEHEQPFAYAAALGALGGSPDAGAREVLAAATADADPRVAYAAVAALRARWEAERDPAAAPFFFERFAEALRRRDLATAYAAAPALADSLFRPLGASDVLRETYAAMAVPDDIEPMVEIVRALGEVRDTSAVGFLLNVALEGPHPTIRQAAAETLSERFGEGVDFEATGLNPPDFPRFSWAQLRALGRHPLLTLRTDRGAVVLELDAEAAPVTVQVIAMNARAGRYDGVPFHRVVSNFVVQGGDFARADGFGGPGYFIPSEFTRIPYERGAVGMASAGKDTEGSQYFVTHSAQPHLDGRYTAFGRVVRGQDVVDALLQGDRVLEARIRPEGGEPQRKAPAAEGPR